VSNPIRIAAFTLLLLPSLGAAPATRQLWEFSPLSWIKRKPAEPGAPANAQPVRVQAAILARALGTVQVVAELSEEALFGEAEAVTLSKALAEALSLAGPGEDLEVLSTSKRNAGFLGESLAVTARMFVQDGRLNVIVHDTRLDFLDRYYAEFKMPEFRFGSRAAASAARLRAAGGEARRPDWVVLPLVGAAEAVPVAAPVAAVPVVATVPVKAPVVVPPAPVQAAPEQSLETRLRDLKRRRDQKLITEAEYAKAKQDLLKEF